MAVTDRLHRQQLRQLRHAVMKRYRKRGELLAMTEPTTLMEFFTDDEFAELQACRELHQNWSTYQIAEYWHHKCGYDTPANLSQALQMIADWQA